ncbi:hypothetical protein NPIL_150641 [Nephila pilipes]|uniref:Uncharacterized protein n=1 Tax=Nephila pilipes TaxID=299642 RepID=A0A8X6NKM2_NEPPI|nr:hypothetical protein NPIL_150641 [Nephila pilipes]
MAFRWQHELQALFSRGKQTERVVWLLLINRLQLKLHRFATNRTLSARMRRRVEVQLSSKDLKKYKHERQTDRENFAMLASIAAGLNFWETCFVVGL